MNWLCRIGIHRWGKWSEGFAYKKFTDSKELYWYQFRVCEKCNKHQVKQFIES